MQRVPEYLPALRNQNTTENAFPICVQDSQYMMWHNLNYSRNVMTTEIDLDTNLSHFFRPFFFFRSRLNYRSDEK